MFATSRLAARGMWLPLALLVAAGCKPGPTPEMQARMDSLSQASSDRDRLFQEVAENTRLVSDISKELAKVSVPAKSFKVTAESPLRASRDTLIQKIRYVTNRMREIEPKLKESEDHVRELSTVSDSLRNELAATIQNLQSVIDNQKETIESLSGQVDEFSAQIAALKDTIDNLATEVNTVYYVIGTKDELKKRGIIQEEGGAHLLFVLPFKTGQTLVPGRNLDPSLFTAADRRHMSELPLPATDRGYRIVSRQDVTALETPPDGDGKLEGRVKIADSAKFWANSRYLIIVEG
jgi:ABC-type transporter Mla subunit MlaD